jgi:hypothetical protein
MRLEFAQFGIDVMLTEPGARDANLEAMPEQERHYRPALVEMDRAFEKAGADDPQVIVNAVVEGLFRCKRKPRVTYRISPDNSVHQTGYDFSLFVKNASGGFMGPIMLYVHKESIGYAGGPGAFAD